ncbi:hypothetical protein DFJ74DRAFT_602570, partial [Hyaloraphidium curvatum]
VAVLTVDGRFIVGLLKGFDQKLNIILADTEERVFSKSEGVETVPLGLYIVRGENVATIGQLDTEKDATIDWPKVKAEPIRAFWGEGAH